LVKITTVILIFETLKYSLLFCFQIIMDVEKAIPLRLDLLPRKCDVIWHYKHLRNSVTQVSLAFHETTKTIGEIWTRADCPPMNYKSLHKNVEELWYDWYEFQKLKGLTPKDGKKHCRLILFTPSVPTCQSSRSKSSDISASIPSAVSNVNLESSSCDANS
jgi:hypothetical protein